MPDGETGFDINREQTGSTASGAAIVKKNLGP